MDIFETKSIQYSLILHHPDPIGPTLYYKGNVFDIFDTEIFFGIVKLFEAFLDILFAPMDSPGRRA